MRRASFLLLCLALIAPAVAAHAQQWPNRPIKLIVPQGPGSGTDVIARLIADGMTQRLGQPMDLGDEPARDDRSVVGKALVPDVDELEQDAET